MWSFGFIHYLHVLGVILKKFLRSSNHTCLEFNILKRNLNNSSFQSLEHFS